MGNHLPKVCNAEMFEIPNESNTSLNLQQDERSCKKQGRGPQSLMSDTSKYLTYLEQKTAENMLRDAKIDVQFFFFTTVSIVGYSWDMLGHAKDMLGTRRCECIFVYLLFTA